MRRSMMPIALSAWAALALACETQSPQTALDAGAGADGATLADDAGAPADARAGGADAGQVILDAAATDPDATSADAEAMDSTASIDAGAPPGDAGDAPYDPLVVNATWLYRTTDLVTQQTGDLSTRIEAFEDVGGMKAGTMAYRVRKQKLNGGVSVSWDHEVGGVIVRERDQNLNAQGTLTSEEYYAPYRVRLDETAPHLIARVTYTDAYTQTNINAAGTVVTNKSATWTVEAVGELVTVPAGTFSCLRVRRDAGTAPKTFWFARGVGKVKEEGGQRVELVSYSIPPG